jgi:hypothetical protein
MRSPKLPVLYAALPPLRGINSPKPDALASYLNCVAVGNSGAAGDFVVRLDEDGKKG